MNIISSRLDHSFLRLGGCLITKFLSHTQLLADCGCQSSDVVVAAINGR